MEGLGLGFIVSDAEFSQYSDFGLNSVNSAAYN